MGITPSPPDPVIEAYKQDVDRSLLRHNLSLTVEERLLQAASARRLVEELREAGAKRRARLKADGDR